MTTRREARNEKAGTRLAAEVTQDMSGETTENLRRIRASLTAYHGRLGPQPLGDYLLHKTRRQLFDHGHRAHWALGYALHCKRGLTP
jgi:hypothetical protein